MKIIKTELFTFHIEYKEPFHIAVEETEEKEGVLVKLTSSCGITGLGEAAPTRYVTCETINTCKKVLIDCLFPAVKNIHAGDIAQAHRAMDKAVKNNPSAKTAVDNALYDIMAKAAGLPLYKYLGGVRNKIKTDMTIGINPPEYMAKSAKKFVKAGFGVLKVKLGTTPEEDIERIKQVRKAAGEKIIIRVDANQGWGDYKTAAKAINGIEKYNIEFVEQPVKMNDFAGFKKLKKLTRVPLAADESARTLNDVKKLIHNESVDVINIKLMKCGGIYRGLEIADFCAECGIPCMIGGMCETKVAVAASAHLACAHNNFKYADLDGDLLLDDKLVKKASIGLRNGYRTLKNYPGLGIMKLNEKILKRI